MSLSDNNGLGGSVERAKSVMAMLQTYKQASETPTETPESVEDCGLLRPVTVRFSVGAWKAIRDIAAENGVSQAELVRMAVTGNLADYLGAVRILDKQQAKEVKQAIVALMDTVSKVQMELNRIGINYNQEIRLKQIERKYKGAGMNFDRLNAKFQEEKRVKDECQGFDRKELDALLTRYEKATEQVGAILCRILT